MHEATVCHLLRGDNGNTEVLLGERSGLFANNKWNGPGGKLRGSEGVRHCLKREVKEEVGSTIDLSSVEHFATVDFYHKFLMEHRLEWTVHFLTATRWTGEPRPLDGFNRLEWCPYDDLPYDRLMSDQIAWLPLALRRQPGKLLLGEIFYAGDESSPVERGTFRFVDWKEYAFKRRS
ncbi:MAG: NUDIX domain-containing protein [Candidatus Paceibacterota bacterium]